MAHKKINDPYECWECGYKNDGVRLPIYFKAPDDSRAGLCMGCARKSLSTFYSAILAIGGSAGAVVIGLNILCPYLKKLSVSESYLHPLPVNNDRLSRLPKEEDD